MAQIVRFDRLGGPEVLRFEREVEPPALGDGEVRLRVHAIGLNRCEAQFRRGQYVEAPALPARIGYEAAGVVEEVSPSVEGLAPGDRLATLPGFSMSRNGVYGETAIVPAAATAPWPDALRATEAASIWMAFLTAWGGLVDVGGVRAGDWALVPAASSAVGLACIQTLKREGAGVIATTRDPRKREAIGRAGAAHVIVTGREDLAARVAEITSGRGADMIFDPVAGPRLGDLAGAAADRGRLVVYGYFGGLEAPLPLIPMFMKGLRVEAFSVLRLVNEPARLARGIRYVEEGLRSGAFRPVIDRTFAFGDVVAAHAYIESNEQVGKIVLRVVGP